MIRVNVYCEGQTEESFVNRILYPYFYKFDIFLTPIICNIKSTQKGGVSKYGIIKKEITNLCKQDPSAYVTTMLDYYGLPYDTPGMKENISGSVFNKVSDMENKIFKDIVCENFIPNIIIHEYEGLLFSDVECFEIIDKSSKKLKHMKKIYNSFDTPEHINNGVQTAPSKRIQNIYEHYSKIIDGVDIADEIGLYKIMSECEHFRLWIDKLEKICK